MARAFASQADLEEKQITFEELADGLYAYTAEGDPNSGVIVGDDSVMVVDTQATPAMAADVIARIRQVTDKPIDYVCLTHYHAVRVLGASAYGARHILASQGTYDLIVERGQQDYQSEVGRFPRLFQDVGSIPGLTWPTMVFDHKLTLFLGEREVQIMHLGRGHTKGDTVVWLPKEKVLFAGDLVEFGATPYTGDAYLRDWPKTLAALRALGPEKLIPGRGAALKTAADCETSIAGTQAFLTTLYQTVAQGVEAGKPLKDIYDATFTAMQPAYGDWVIFEHCMPFDVSRAYDEASGFDDPRIWTAERDVEMWKTLEQADKAAEAARQQQG
ncbi:MBL fold metallo-hydrolase [Algihabitans albus]|uniref:MBL fold metallo-hydrolase n=1 Tax=Algihabitans albus TaxID=2164067 RepID=UPI000E5C8972|nr:MBL fold metallo-hydrolase [Algihabitans albus]